MGRFTGIIDNLKLLITRDEQTLAIQRRSGWRSPRVGQSKPCDLPEHTIENVQARIAENKKRLEAYEKCDAKGS